MTTENLLKIPVDGMIYWNEEKRGYKVMAKDKRYIVCSKSMFGNALYSVIDTELGICGAINYWSKTNFLDKTDCERVLAELYDQFKSIYIVKYKSAQILDVVDIERTLNKIKI